MINKNFVVSITFLGLAALVGAGVTYANFENPRQHEIMAFYPVHSHSVGGDTIDAPQHSGGTDRFGCHNASVPYHCH
jgi:hypothetical protein